MFIASVFTASVSFVIVCEPETWAGIIVKPHRKFGICISAAESSKTSMRISLDYTTIQLDLYSGLVLQLQCALFFSYITHKSAIPVLRLSPILVCSGTCFLACQGTLSQKRGKKRNIFIFAFRAVLCRDRWNTFMGRKTPALGVKIIS